MIKQVLTPLLEHKVKVLLNAKAAARRAAKKKGTSSSGTSSQPTTFFDPNPTASSSGTKASTESDSKPKIKKTPKHGPDKHGTFRVNGKPVNALPYEGDPTGVLFRKRDKEILPDGGVLRKDGSLKHGMSGALVNDKK
ncbi:MAG: hypothetical protein Q9162_007097 [Coniocarpon cinnabarinum]